MQHVFIVGSKSMGAYGGYETFVNKLTEYHQNNENIKYHIACKANGDGSMDESKLDGAEKISDNEFEYHNAHCFKITVPNIGPASAIYYDVAALKFCCEYIRKNEIENPIVYILACRIGPFAAHYQRKIHKLGGKVYLNPDGHEWKRAKWSAPIRKYWKISEQMMIKHSDFVICDSVNIEKYILESYGKYNPNTTFIAYGADTTKSTLQPCDEKVVNWYKDKDVTPGEYYLVVGRFVPENNYETMIKEFMKSDTDKDFVIITNVEGNAFYENLRKTTNFESDPRIKFVGTVYDQELLKRIREDAYAYFHGHEVGGTNPSLLEALAITKLNLLLDVGFNREVGEDGALYWNKEDGNLANLINKADQMSSEEINKLSVSAKKRIRDYYSWEYIADKYEKAFLK
ncbi:MAG: beta 1-4 rhamnosyltransferase Cps2T [Clostridia bacterium]